MSFLATLLKTAAQIALGQVREALSSPASPSAAPPHVGQRDLIHIDRQIQASIRHKVVTHHTQGAHLDLPMPQPGQTGTQFLEDLRLANSDWIAWSDYIISINDPAWVATATAMRGGTLDLELVLVPSEAP